MNEILYDSFISYNRDDYDIVNFYVQKLINEEKLQLFFDRRELVAGEKWIDRLTEGILKSKSITIFIGINGIGSWQDREIKIALNQRKEKEKFRFIPVLLPGAKFEQHLPPLLKEYECADFNQNYELAFNNLLRGIRYQEKKNMSIFEEKVQDFQNLRVTILFEDDSFSTNKTNCEKFILDIVSILDIKLEFIEIYHRTEINCITIKLPIKYAIDLMNIFNGDHILKTKFEKQYGAKSTKISSPFEYMNPVYGKKFCNREMLLEEIIKITCESSLGNIWLIGARQVGKTSILRQLAYLNQTTEYKTCENKIAKFVYIDCHGIEKDRFFDEIADVINEELDLKLNKSKYSDFFVEVFRKIFELNFYIVLLLDEFDTLIRIATHKEQISFINLIQKIRSRIGSIKLKGSPKLISAVFSSGIGLDEFTKIFLSFKHVGSPINCKEIEITWFDNTNIEELAKLYLPDNTNLLDQTDVFYCFQLSKGHPRLVQKVLEQIFDNKLERNIDNAIIKEELKRFLKESTNIWIETKIPFHIVNHFSQLEKQFPDMEIKLKDEIYHFFKGEVKL